MNKNDHIEELFEQYADMIYQTAISCGSPVPSAEDIVQKVFCYYLNLKKKPQFRGSLEEREWFTRITVKYCKNKTSLRIKSARFKEDEDKAEIAFQEDNEFYLNPEQKSNIWLRMAAEDDKGQKTKRKIPVWVAVCICALVSAGIVAAASDIVKRNRMLQAYGIINGEKQALSKEQKNIYTKYTDLLDKEIPLENGTLTLDAILTDGYCVCIPFTINLSSETIPKGRKLSDSLFMSKASMFVFCMSDNTSWLSQNTMFDKRAPESDSATGCYLLSGLDREIKTGETILIKEAATREDASMPLVSELTIGKAMERRSIATDTMKLPKGIFLKKITLSPLSLRIEGREKEKGNDERFIYSSEVTLKLKDGSEIKQGDVNSSSGKDDTDKKGYYSYRIMMIFGAPINLDDVAAILFQNDALILEIPVSY